VITTSFRDNCEEGIMKFRAKDIMTTLVVTIPPEATIDKAFALLLRHHISGLLVVDQDDHLHGVISELDLLRLLYDAETKQECVGQYCSREVVSVRVNDPLHEVTEIFLDNPFRRVPVLNSDDKVVGVISRRDLVRYIHEVRQRISAVMDSRKRSRREKQSEMVTA
jgi:CBS domain-containing protein